MEFIQNATVADLKRMGVPTFNDCEHYLVKPQAGTQQTLTIDLGNGKHLTVNINPNADNVDVVLHGAHRYVKHTGDDKEIHSFSGLK